MDLPRRLADRRRPRLADLQAAASRPVLVVLAANVVARGLGFLFPVLLTHAIGRSEFATVIFLVNFGFFVGELVLTGYPSALTQVLASEGDAGRRGAWLAAAVTAGIPLLVASITIGAVLAAQAEAPPLLLALVILGLSIDAYYFGLLRGLQRFGLLAAYRISANLAQLLLLGIAAALGFASVELAVAIYSFVYLVPIAVIEARTSVLAGAIRSGVAFGRDRLRRLTAFAIPSLVSGTAFAAIIGFDVFFVRIFTPESLADYGAARTLALPVTLVPFSIGVVLMPRVAAASAGERGAHLSRALRAVILASLAAWLGYALVGKLIVDLMLPASYAGATDGLRYLVPAMTAIGPYSILSQWWSGLGRPEVPAISLSVGAVVTVVGHLVMTSRLGTPGAAAAIGAGSLTALLLIGGYTVRHWRAASAVKG